MAPQAYQFSPFDQRQPSSLATDWNASGRSAASPGAGNSAGRTLIPEIARHSGDDAPGEPSDLSAPGRHPHVHGEQHDDATSQETVSAVSGRLVSDTDARRVASAVPVADDLGALAGRLERGYRDARRIYNNAEILSRRLQRDMPKPSAGLAYAVNEHAELSEVLDEARAFVVRCAAQPKLPEILAALERGEQVFTVRAHDPSVLYATADNRPCQAGVVGSDVNPTSGLPKLLSGLLRLIFAGHRKSSSPAHHACPSVREQITTDVTACASKNCGYRNQGRRA